MAERVTVELVDDLDGSAADEKILFALGGSQYEIDLSSANAEAFHKALKPYIDAARPPHRAEPRGFPSRARATSAPAREYDPKVVRSWARQNGVHVPDRGRIKPDVVEKWRQATGG